MELFRSQDLVVRQVGTRGGLVIVTFGSYTNEPTLDRGGFGEEFLTRERYDAIHVINRTNRWYQYPEMRDALKAVAAVTAGYDRVLTYGSSMGGYAALRFADLCGADAAIALSPQYSLDPAVVPFETRWQPEAAATRFDEAPYVPAACQYIFYDPRVAPDAQHVALFTAVGNTVEFALPFAGHPVGGLLVETRALQMAIRGIATDRFDADEIRHRIRVGRRRSQHHYFLLGRRAAVRRPELGLTLLQKAAAIEPESHITSAQAIVLDRLGRYAEARPLHRAAVERTPTNPRAWMAFAHHLEVVGESKMAARALRNALPGQPQSVRLQVRLLQLRLALRRTGMRVLDRGVEQMVARIESSPRRAAILRGLGRGVR